MICPNKATSSSPFKYHAVTMHISLDKANINTINISTPDFHISQHSDSNWTTAYMHKLVDMPKVPVTQVYKPMIGQSEPILPFEIKRDTEEGPFLTWKLLTHLGTYIGTSGMIFVVCVGVYCLKRSWFRPATPRHWPYPSVSSWHAILADDVEVALTYRGSGIVEKPVRPCKNHDLCMEWEATRPESHCKQPVLSKAVPLAGPLTTKTKIQEMG